MKIGCFTFTAPLPKLHSIAELFFAFSPQITTRANQHIYVRFELTHWQGKIAEITAHTARLLQPFSLRGNWTFGETAEEALLLSLESVPDLESAHIEALRAYFAPFTLLDDVGSESKKKQFLKGCQWLHQLGVHRIRDFLKLPQEMLAPRLGIFWLETAAKIRAGQGMPWPVFELSERVSEAIPLTDPETHTGCQDLEQFQFYLKRTVDRLSTRLHTRQQAVLKLELKFSNKKQIQRFELELATAQSQSLELQKIITQRIGSLADRGQLSLGVYDFFEIEARTLTRDRYLQKDFWNSHAGVEEQVSSLIARLTEKLGKEKAFFVELHDHYQPELAWSRTLHPVKKKIPDVFKKIPQRPTRLLSPRIRLGSLADLDCHFKIIDWAPPERLRLFSMAWRESDFFKIQTHDRRTLWLERDRHDGVFYLRGYFD